MPTTKYKSSDYLKTPKAVAAYLNEALKDDDPRLLMLAIRNVADASDGVAGLAEASGLNRESLYKALSGARAPRIDTLSKVLRSYGLRLSVSVSKKRAA